MIPPPPPPIPLKKNNSNAHVSSQKRKKISNGKKKSYKKSIQTTNSSAISDLSNANVYKPEHYWNDRAKEWSEKLWLPIMNDYAGSPMDCSSMCSPSSLQNSWFSSTIRRPMITSYPNISLPPVPSLSIESSIESKEEEQPCTEGKKKKKNINSEKRQEKKT
ncbi:hypothetical protein C2G38_2146582 [Gigaspora rosea]|uniref:Uncharacterized protein n=1 Tax=Gigaspora rosea TaxID=44941 RepID=A0A397UGI9_9GLOM|nr:hypothetical protein C2G38_2146582 [Gigaspora rosea]